MVPDIDINTKQNFYPVKLDVYLILNSGDKGINN